MFEVEKKTVTNDAGAEHLQYSISGTLDIESVTALKHLLLEGFSASDYLVLDWYAVDEVDFSVLQLMCAINIYAYQQGKIFELKNRLTPQVQETAKRLGFMREAGCSRENRERCLWVNC